MRLRQLFKREENYELLKKKKKPWRDKVQVWKQVDFYGWNWVTKVETDRRKNAENS